MSKPGRNDLCPCGSGKKYKKCHEAKETGGARGRMLIVVIGAVVAAVAVAVAMSFTGQGDPAGVHIWDPVHGHYHDANGVEVP